MYTTGIFFEFLKFFTHLASTCLALVCHGLKNTDFPSTFVLIYVLSGCLILDKNKGQHFLCDLCTSDWQH